MNRSDTEILEQIEQGLLQDDAAFVRRMTPRAPLATWSKVRFAVLAYLGLIMVMMYTVNIGFAIAGYAVLITATTDLIRRFRTSSDSADWQIAQQELGQLATSLD